ncbi:exopolysaccharide biosynthesis protein [Elioraea sp.]|uniref:exopolysaccharide biosynthesis protein n=1 Tax=Elioraea sp. TaxID=2185103 RepID=UPI003F712467
MLETSEVSLRPVSGPMTEVAPPPPSPPEGGNGRHLPVSALMLELARTWPKPRISLGEMIHAFGARGYGILIILFALPNLLPIYIPGWSPIFGIPLAIVCLQLALGYPEPRLPRVLTERSMKREDLQMIVEKAIPWVQRIERFIRPRPSVLTEWKADRLVGAYGVFLACLVIIPLPFTNGPPSLACAIMAMGLLEEDSRAVAAGAVVGLLATALTFTIIGGLFWVALRAIGLMF